MGKVTDAVPEVKMQDILGDVGTAEYECLKAIVDAGKKAEDALKPYTTTIKDWFSAKGWDKAVVGNYTMNYVVQDRSTLNEEALVTLLKAKRLNAAIITKQVPDPEKVAGYIALGKLTADEYNSCLDSNLIPTLKAKVNKPRVELKDAFINQVTAEDQKMFE